MLGRCVIAAVVALSVSGVCAGERWLIERGPGQGLAAGDAWMPGAAELMLRCDLSGLAGLTLLSKGDVKWDVATLELVRLSSATGETRVTLGKFARARGLIVVDVAGADRRVTLRVIDLQQPDRERTFSTDASPDGVESAVAKLVPDVLKFLGRTPTPDELARMKRPARLTDDALVALAKSLDAKTPVECELFTRLATTHAPEAPLAWYLHARALHETARPLEAISAYRRAIMLDASVSAYHYDLGNAFFDEKRYAEAAAEYQQAISLDFTHAAGHENYVRAQKQLGKTPAEILTSYAEILGKAYPTVAVAQLQTGRLQWEMGKRAEALAAFRRAVELDPADPIMHFDYAHALEGAANSDEAVAQYKQTIELAPNYAKAHNNLARLYETQDREALALFHYQQAVKYAPDYALAWNNLGILYGKRGRHRLEVEAFRKQVKLTPDDAVAWFNLGVGYHRMREYDAAIAAYRKSLELRDDDKLTHWQLAQAYERTATWNLAARHWRRVLELNPTDEERRTAEKHIAENANR